VLKECPQTPIDTSMAAKRRPGAIVDLSERRAQRARQAFDDASRGMREAEQALFETLRHADRLEQSARAKREAPPPKPSPRAGGDRRAQPRVIPFRRVRAA
jgi:hypothetical protein